jgi:hypothetical protein
MSVAQALQLLVQLAIQGLDLGWSEENRNPGRERRPDEFLAGGREEEEWDGMLAWKRNCFPSVIKRLVGHRRTSG